MSEKAISEELLSELAHDLRTPISVIVGYAELIAKRSEEPKMREAAGNIMDAAERLRSTVDRLVHEARAE